MLYYYLGQCIHLIVDSVLESALRVEVKRRGQKQMLGFSLEYHIIKSTVFSKPIRANDDKGVLE